MCSYLVPFAGWSAPSKVWRFSRLFVQSGVSFVQFQYRNEVRRCLTLATTLIWQSRPQRGFSAASDPAPERVEHNIPGVNMMQWQEKGRERFKDDTPAVVSTVCLARVYRGSGRDRLLWCGGRVLTKLPPTKRPIVVVPEVSKTLSRYFHASFPFSRAVVRTNRQQRQVEAVDESACCAHCLEAIKHITQQGTPCELVHETSGVTSSGMQHKTDENRPTAKSKHLSQPTPIV